MPSWGQKVCFTIKFKVQSVSCFHTINYYLSHNLRVNIFGNHAEIPAKEEGPEEEEGIPWYPLS